MGTSATLSPPTPIKAGSIVRLAAGGPPMTVELINSYGAVCVWMDLENHLQREQIDVAALIKHSGYVDR